MGPAVPWSEQAYNGQSFYVWSPGDPHILGAYSYLKVGQYTGFNGIQGQREGTCISPASRRRVDFPGLQSRADCAAATVRH